MSIIELTDDTIPTNTSVIKFSAQWCLPCKKIAPLFNKLAKQYTDIHFYDVDVDENQLLAERMNITGMPTFVFLKEKKEILRLTGADEKKLSDALKTFSS